VLPARSFSGPSPAKLMTMFYCLKFETIYIYIRKEQGGTVIPPGIEFKEEKTSFSFHPSHFGFSTKPFSLFSNL
jgi:hypothetical protein